MSETARSQDELVAIVETVCEVLAQETELIQACDLVEAGALLARKREAVVGLQRALAQGEPAAELAEDELERLHASFSRLRECADENRAALERALALQLQVMQAIAHAVPTARADQAPVYQPNGSRLPPRPPEAYAFASRM